MKVLIGLIICMSCSFSLLAQEAQKIGHISYSFAPFSLVYDELTKDSLLMTVELSLSDLNGLRGIYIKLGTDSLPEAFMSEYLKVIIRDGQKYLQGSGSLYAVTSGKIVYKKTIDRSKCNGISASLAIDEHLLRGSIQRRQFNYQF